MENEELDKTLLREMIEGLTRDVSLIKDLLEKQPKPTTLLDAKSSLEKISSAYSGLKSYVDAQLAKEKEVQPQAQIQAEEPAWVTEFKGFRQEMRHELRKSPANRISKAVQYGTILLALSLILTGVLAYYATKWWDERNAFEVSDWKWRAVQQDGPDYATKMNYAFTSDSTAQYYKARIVKLEQADAAREAAQKAVEQAKAMNAQADQLEGKASGKGKKKQSK